MSFTPDREQLATARTVNRRGRRRGASLRERLAALETILVEADGRDVNGGDRDSSGAFQQRPSQGWGSASDSLARDADQFYDAAAKVRVPRGRGAGYLAQSVQRSAFPDRYRERRGDALALLRAVDRGGGGGVAGAAASGVGGSSTIAGFDPGAPGGMAPLEQAGPPQARVPSAGLQAPAFSAQAVMPEAAPGIPASGGGPAPKPGIDLPAMASQAASFGGPSVGAQRVAARASTGKGGLRPARNSAAGWVDALGAWASDELGLAPGSRDRSVGENAAVGGAAGSDHIEGDAGSSHHEAVDLPTTPANGGWGQYRQVVRRLGLKPDADGFTQGIVRLGGKKFRVQVIFGEKNDHGDHIHVGFRRA